MSLPRVRAPREHGATLAEPPLEQAGSLLDANRRHFAEARLDLLGRPLAELRSLARRETWAAAAAYAAASGDPPPAPPGDVWLLAGHQPELFHPGVWFKNFALHGLANSNGAFALNLVVDNDTAKSSLLRLPAHDHLVNLPFDTWRGEVPYEERRVLDESLFASLPERVQPYVGDWKFEPLLSTYWAEVLRQAEHTPLLGERLAAARRVLERHWGLVQAEVPLSLVCQTEAFAWFAGHLISDLPRFHALYNETVQDYRRRHGLKSRNHPVPDLAQEGDWLEAPFWAWRAGQARRGRLFVRFIPGAVQLRAGDKAWPELPRARLVTAWRGLEGEGYKIRTRALTTTLFARLCLADLFLHGIGGGKYDELTDALCERFYGLRPPAFLVLSATLLLPLPRPDVRDSDCRRLARLCRDVHYNPQRHLVKLTPEAAELVRQKSAWIAREGQTHAERVERFVQLREITGELCRYTREEEERLRQARDACREESRVQEVLGRRDYASCLYPEGMLREFFQRYL